MGSINFVEPRFAIAISGILSARYRIRFMMARNWEKQSQEKKDAHRGAANEFFAILK